jgi:hypothetical protein
VTRDDPSFGDSGVATGRATGATALTGVASGTSFRDGVVENSALETIAALAATPTTSAPLLTLTSLITCDHMLLPHPSR